MGILPVQCVQAELLQCSLATQEHSIYHERMSEKENEVAAGSVDAIKAKIKKFENSRTLIAGLFVLLCYYFYDSYKDGISSVLYYVVIGILMAIDIGVFAYVTVLIRKLAKERKELEK